MALMQLSIFSDELKMMTTVYAVMPQPKLNDAPINGYPVLWLLHGYGDDSSIWERRTSIERYSSYYGLCVIMPSSYIFSYADMAHGGKYYSYIAKELPEKLSGMLAISKVREDNFIAGLSMGGAGAMKIGLSNPDKYCAIGCLSAGAVNRGKGGMETPEQLKRREMLYGSRLLEGTEEDVFGNAERLAKADCSKPRIYHACGSEDFILPSARVTRDYFMAIKDNPFDYKYEENPGIHSWEFWDEHIKHFIDYLGLPLKKEMYYN